MASQLWQPSLMGFIAFHSPGKFGVLPGDVVRPMGSADSQSPFCCVPLLVAFSESLARHVVLRKATPASGRERLFCGSFSRQLVWGRCSALELGAGMWPPACP